MTSVGAGNYASAAIPLEAALMIREKELGPDHADTVRVLNGLGTVSLALGRPEEAEALLRRALTASEKALGPDHPDVADILHNLANVYASSDDVRRVEQSLPLLERAATVRAKALWPDHPRVAEAINRMAAVDLFLAERAGAWQMPDLLAGVRRTPASLARPKLSREEYLAHSERGFKQALAIREKALGPDHPAVASALASLAAVYTARTHYAQAEPLLKRALAISEKTLGPNHPATANILDDYADALSNARKDSASLAEAKAMKIRARAILDGQVRRASADAPRDSSPVR
jgi:tetratricopeptide (TPR) repeat protein